MNSTVQQLLRPDPTTESSGGLFERPVLVICFNYFGLRRRLCVCEKPLGDSHVQQGLGSAALEEHHALCHELSAKLSSVQSRKGGDFSNYKLHPGCGLQLPGEGFTTLMRGPYPEILTP